MEIKKENTCKPMKILNVFFKVESNQGISGPLFKIVMFDWSFVLCNKFTLFLIHAHLSGLIYGEKK